MKNKTVSISGKSLFILALNIGFLLTCITDNLHAQQIEIAGSVKIANMDKVDTADSMVVRLSDGTLAVRDASTLSIGNGADTNRSWISDLLLTSAVCNCSNLNPARIQSLLAHGYTVNEL